jgi:hypothetical protein
VRLVGLLPLLLRQLTGHDCAPKGAKDAPLPQTQAMSVAQV